MAAMRGALAASMRCCGLTLPSRGRHKGRFAPFAPPLMSNVRPRRMQPTPRSLSWNEVLGFYEDLAQKPGCRIEPLVDLVRFLAESPYARSLFPYTSHADLHIGRVR